ncbi:hypothetical protein [Bacteroides reticulotermitis]|uniref:hypothetical protein n=1 Tax=Bacteroides reticulotermitis TaxID=1133319 RepID=UPI003A88A395
MKKVFYKSKLAKFLLFSSYTTITLFAWVFTKLAEHEVKQSVVNHECVHARQWTELTFSSGLLLWLGIAIFGFSIWWLAFAPFAFYAWYLFEYLVRRFFGLFARSDNKQKTAYRLVSFEQEARLAEKDPNYLENSMYFAWLKFYRK